MVEVVLASHGSLGSDAFSGTTGVQSARVHGPVWSLQVSAAHEAIPAILGRVDEAGATIAELRVHTPTLEDAFVSLTGRHLRDE
jgi:ABC-2 type transport system ATP-binding protein